MRFFTILLTAVFWLTLLGCTTDLPPTTPTPTKTVTSTPSPSKTPTLPPTSPLVTSEPTRAAATPTATPLPTLPPATLPPPDPAAIVNNKHILYYSASDGHYYRVGSDGQNPEQITLEPDGGHGMQDLVEQSLLDFSPPRVSPNGRYLIQHFGPNPWVVLELSTQHIAATGRSDLFFAPTWAPDSERFSYIKNNRQLCIVTIANQSEACLWESDEDLFGAAWSPNGRLIAVAKNQPGCCVGEIWLIDAETGQAFRGESFEGTLEPNVNSIFKWLPEGNGLLIYALPEGGSAILYPDDGLTMRLSDGAFGFAPNGRYFYTPAGQLVDANQTWEHQISDPLACASGILSRQHAWSPDSSHIAIVAACDDSEELFAEEWTLQIIETSSGTLWWEKKLPQAFDLLDWSADGSGLILRRRTTGWPKDSMLHTLAADGRSDPQPLVSGAIYLGSFAQWLGSEAATMPAASPTMLAREEAVGLVLADARTEQSWQLITAEGTENLNSVEAAQLLGGIFNFVVRDAVLYTLRNQNVKIDTGYDTIVIPTSRAEKFVYGFVGDWLLVGFVEPDEGPSQTMGALGAMSLDGVDFRLISEERAYTIPIIAPDNSMAVYVEGGEAKAWFADGSSQPLPYGDFRSGAFSPNGSHLALIRNRQLDVYNVATQQLVVSSSDVMMGGDGFMFPRWHPNGSQVAFNIYLEENERPFATRLLSLDGTVMDIADSSFPIFHPDGNLLALYQNITEPKTIFLDLTSGERFDSTFSGVPVGWVR